MGAVGFVRDQPDTDVVHTLWIWSTHGSEPLRTIHDSFADIQCLAFSPDGTTVATGTRGEINLWEIATGNRRSTLNLEPTLSFFSLSFTPDGESLAIIEMGKGIKIFSLQEGTATLIPIPTIGGSTVYFSTDGRYLAFSTYDPVLLTWDHLVVWDRVLGTTHLEAPGTPQGFAPNSRSLAVIRGEKQARKGTLSLLDTETGRALEHRPGAGDPAIGSQFRIRRKDDLRGVGQCAEVI